MISVIIPYYRNESTVEATIRSTLTQTYRDIEVILVDCEGSFDMDSVNDIEIVNDKRLRVVTAEGLGSAASARNYGIGCACGEYVAYLDADDMWSPDKLELQLRCMSKVRRHGEAPVICCTGRALIDEQGRNLNKYIPCRRYIDYTAMLRSNHINCSSVLMRKDVAERYPFPEGELHEDYAVWLTILRDGGYAVGIDRPLLKYRVSKGSRSGNKLRSAAMTYRVYKYMKLPFARRVAYFISYAVNGLRKYGTGTR